MRIELTCSAWKADILPLNYTRIFTDALIVYEINGVLSIIFSKFLKKICLSFGFWEAGEKKVKILEQSLPFMEIPLVGCTVF
jgi:hypothetical protein